MGGGGSATQTQAGQQTDTYDPWVQNQAQQTAQQAFGNYGQNLDNAQQTANTGAGMYQSGNALINQSGNYNLDTFRNQFMNPYTQDVVKQNADIAQRNFNQQTAPSLMGQLGSQGQFNSGRADQAMALASTQNQQNVNQINAQLMQSGYQNSQENYLKSMGIGVQAGTNLAQLGLSGQQLPGNIFNQYSQGLSGLPLNRQQNQQGNSTQPVSGSNGLF